MVITNNDLNGGRLTKTAKGSVCRRFSAGFLTLFGLIAMLLSVVSRAASTVDAINETKINAINSKAPAPIDAPPSAQGFIFFDGSTEDKKQIEALQSQLQTVLPKWQFDLINISRVAKKAIANEISSPQQCLITFGMAATQQLLSLRKSNRVFALNVPSNQLNKLHRVYQPLKVPVSGIYQEQSFEKQLQLVKSLTPEVKQVGIIVSQIDKFLLPELIQTASKMDIKLNYRILQPTESAEGFLTQVSQENGYFILLNNQQLFDADKLASVVLTATNQKIKLIGARSDSTNYGAMMSVYPDVSGLLYEAAIDIKSYCADQQSLLPHFARQYTLGYNYPIAEHLGIILTTNDHLMLQINSQEKNLNLKSTAIKNDSPQSKDQLKVKHD